MSTTETTASSPPPEHKKIFLAAVDESEESIHALSWFANKILPASSSSHQHRSTLVLLYVKPPPPLYFSPDGHVFSADVMAAMDKYRNDVAECVMVKAKRVCKEAAGDNDNGDYQVKVETMIENGDARDVICQVAEKLGVDVLVMGSHGYGPIKRAFLGSVSNHCAQNVKCPILIIKRPKSNKATTSDS